MSFPHRCYLPCCEGAIYDILHMHNVIATDMFFAVYNDTRTAHVTATSDHDQITRVKFDVTSDLILNEIKFDGVVYSDDRIGVADGATIVGDNVWHTPVTESNFLHLQEFVGCFFGSNSVNNEATLDVVEDAEVLFRLLDGEYVCKKVSPLERECIAQASYP